MDGAARFPPLPFSLFFVTYTAPPHKETDFKKKKTAKIPKKTGDKLL